MRVLIVCYATPAESPCGKVMSRELTEGVATGSHEVTPLTGSPNHPKGVLYPGRRRWPQIDHTTPFRRVRTWHGILRSRWVLPRSLFIASFAVTSFLNALLRGRFERDLLGWSSGPLV